MSLLLLEVACSSWPVAGLVIWAVVVALNTVYVLATAKKVKR